MNLHKIVFALGALLLGLSLMPVGTSAQSPPNHRFLKLRNPTNHRVWTTFYAQSPIGIRRIVCDAGWAPPGRSYGCSFLHIGNATYYARAEVAKLGDTSVHPHIVCDTTGHMPGVGSDRTSVIHYNGRGCWLQ